MSKLLWILWKSLIISPAVLGATLVVSALEVGAVEGVKLPQADKPAATEAQEKSVSIAAASIAPEAETAPVFSAKATPIPVEPTVAELEAPKQVAANSTQVTSANSELDATELMPAQLEVAPKLAQAAPAAPSNSEILDQINQYNREGQANPSGQVTSVGQLRDVSPGDWAFEALRSLVERYGCIAGYPDGTFRGNRALTRFEFAAGLNACLQQIERLIGVAPGETGDLDTIRRLIQEFEAELATLGARVDNLEGRVAFLEDNQFSTTTKLSGEVIFAITDEFNVPVTNNTVFQNRVRLELNTSFTGQDRLVTRLAAGNGGAENQFTINNEAFGTSFVDTQTFNLSPGPGNDVFVDWLAYYFPFGNSQVYIGATGGIHSDYAPTLNPFFEDFDGGNGALSTFASSSPIYRIGGGSGAAVSLAAGPLQRVLGPSTLTIGYLAGPEANNPGVSQGLFNGEYAALAQLNFNLGDRIGLGATYVHGYHRTGSAIFDLGSGNRPVVGTALANNPSSIIQGGDVPTVTNSYGIQAALRLTENISISGFGAYTDAILLGRGSAEIWTYGAGVALSDFGREGNILGIFGGAQPYLGGTQAPGQDYNIRRGERGVPWHIEAFYKFQLTDNISVTPGVIWLINPNQITTDNDAVIGTLRTTFRF